MILGLNLSKITFAVCFLEAHMFGRGFCNPLVHTNSLVGYIFLVVLEFNQYLRMQVYSSSCPARSLLGGFRISYSQLDLV